MYTTSIQPKGGTTSAFHKTAFLGFSDVLIYLYIDLPNINSVLIIDGQATGTKSRKLLTEGESTKKIEAGEGFL